jgi:biotin-dependent carboxylase-like uncharacterized protein
VSGALEVVATGPLATVQDRGRPGWAHLAVSPSGAADPDALDLANRLVGNRPGTAAVEVTLGGLVVRAVTGVVVAVAGPPVEVRVGGTGVGAGRAVSLSAGDELALGVPPRGLRNYLAVRGGVEVPVVLGSRSTDTLGGLGSPPLAPGDRLAAGPEPTDLPAPDQVPLVAPDEPAVLTLRPGPRLDWFEPDALDRLARARWVVRSESDRIGVRLDGPPLRRVRTTELASEGLVVGAVQVPPDGRPVVFLADHPTTGGYPVVAVVASEHRSILGQLRPGAAVRFVTTR